MITSSKQEVRFTPLDLCDDTGRPIPGAPVYIIETPTVFTRSQWNRALLNIGARQVSTADLLATLRRGVMEVVAEDLRGDLLGFVQEFEDSSQGLEDEIAAAQADEFTPDTLAQVLERHGGLVARMEDLEGQMRQMYPPYARKLGDQVFWMESAPLIAAQLFLKGGENTDVEIRRERGWVPDDILDTLPRAHVRELGWHAVRLMFPDADDAKNSARPSSSGGSQKRSSRALRAHGTSGAKRSKSAQP